jgi:hypothetical protein
MSNHGCYFVKFLFLCIVLASYVAFVQRNVVVVAAAVVVVVVELTAVLLVFHQEHIIFGADSCMSRPKFLETSTENIIHLL